MQGEGDHPPLKRSGKGEGLHKRSAEAWGDSLRARGAAPIRKAFFLCVRVSARIFRAGVAGRNEGVTKLTVAVGQGGRCRFA